MLGPNLAACPRMSRAEAKAVLVVDDDRSVRRVLAQLVSSLGYSVFEAEDGQEAWHELLRTRPDIVVSDLQMPNCDGRELCRRIRADPSMRHVRIVIVTGCGEMLECRELHCDVVLAKPIPLEIFRETLGRVGCATADV
jgi:CheY-like chemotaxis protein